MKERKRAVTRPDSGEEAGQVRSGWRGGNTKFPSRPRGVSGGGAEPEVRVYYRVRGRPGRGAAPSARALGVRALICVASLPGSRETRPPRVAPRDSEEDRRARSPRRRGHGGSPGDWRSLGPDVLRVVPGGPWLGRHGGGAAASAGARRAEQAAQVGAEQTGEVPRRPAVGDRWPEGSAREVQGGER